ncbi:transposase [Streptomyces olivaceoviridis]|uniref:transposase n=1 Tax=Streptomyces olivaceoviridis TaxID=1921 RepID=UPI00379B06DC
MDAHHLIWPSELSVVVGIVERLVPDELWGLFQRVVPEAPTRPQGGGRRRHGDREVLAAIVFVATSGCTWQQLPTASFGPSGATAHRRFTEWTHARVWAKLHRLVLDELGSRGELDWSRCAIDSVNMRALVQGIPPVRSRRGPRRRRPAKLHADKGYDYAHLWRWLSARGIRHRIARKGMDSSQRLGRHRWVVERTISWLAGCRRLHRRCERKPEHFLAFTSIACTLICLRRRTR